MVFGVCLAGTSHGAGAFSVVNLHTADISSSLKTQISLNESAVQDASKFIDRVAQQGIGFLSDENLSETQRSTAFRKLLKSNFDMQTIGRFALGRYWREASKQQQDEYLKLFNEMVVDVYSDRFKEYQGQQLDVQDARADGKSDVIVHSVIKSNEGIEVSVDWRVRHKNSDYKVVDVIVEGVSMALTQRSDFSSVIQRGGGDVQVLLDHLRKE